MLHIIRLAKDNEHLFEEMELRHLPETRMRRKRQGLYSFLGFLPKKNVDSPAKMSSEFQDGNNRALSQTRGHTLKQAPFIERRLSPTRQDLG